MLLREEYMNQPKATRKVGLLNNENPPRSCGVLTPLFQILLDPPSALRAVYIAKPNMIVARSNTSALKIGSHFLSLKVTLRSLPFLPERMTILCEA